MRILRLLLLLAAVGVAAFVARDYWSAQRTLAEAPTVAPLPITADVNSQSGRWTWEQSSGDAARVSVSAGGFRQGAHDAAIELSDVKLRIFHDDEESFDLVECPAAVFDVASNLFSSDGEVTITLAVPADQAREPNPSLTRIHTSAAQFDTKAGSADTDAPARYEFDGGRGSSLGARYDSSRRLFRMKSQAFIESFPKRPGAASTLIRAGQLYYHESDDRIDLLDGASLEQDGRRVDAARASVRLEQGRVRSIDAVDAAGLEVGPGRRLRFRTPHLEAQYSDLALIEHVAGTGASELISERGASRTRATGNRFDLFYEPDPSGGESLLDHAEVHGKGVIDVVPSRPGEPGESRHIAAEVIRLQMRPGGRDLQLVETLEPGSIELRPIQPGGSVRRLEADRIKVFYGDGNHMEKLDANGRVFVRREPDDPKAAVLLTWSDALEADFDGANAGTLDQFHQWGSFRFEQGARRGSAQEALFDPRRESIELINEARLDDANGSVEARRIVIDQARETLFAQGNVASAYREEAVREGTENLFDAGKPVYASGSEMESDQRSGVVVYRGQARLWQRENRVEADLIRIDRERKTLAAEGSVLTLLRDADGSNPAAAETAMVEVRAERMHYSDKERLAAYRGGSVLKRKQLIVRSKELDAHLSPPQSDSDARLQTAEARGDVRILDSAAGRRGISDWALYNADEENLILRGSPAKASNRNGEETHGAELTYLINGDSLLVSGGDQRAYTYRRRSR